MTEIFKKEYTIKSKNIKVTVSPAIECLGVIFVLGNFKSNVVRCNEKYRKQIEEFFNGFQKHEVIEFCRKFLDGQYDAPVELFICIQNNVQPRRELLKRLNLRLEEFKLLVNKVEQFVNESNFEKFFELNKSYFKTCIERYMDRIKDFSPEKYLFKFLGMKSDKLNILCMFGVTTSNYGINCNNNLYCCIRPYFKSRFEGDLDFAYDLVYSTTLVLHEFAHSFINPLTDKYIKHNEISYEKCKEAFEQNVYGTHRKTVVNETIIRAIECLYVKQYLPDGYQAHLDDYISDGFICIEETMKSLEYYNQNREKYKTIEEYYPVLVEIFK